MTSYKPNTFVVTPEVWNVLQDHPDFIARINGGATNSQPAIVTLNLMAQVLGLDRILVAEAVQNIAIEGSPEDMQFVFGKNCLLVYAAPQAGLMTPTAGLTFEWTGLVPGGVSVEKFRIRERKLDRIEVEAAWDQKVVSAEMGTFFSGVIS